MSILVRDYWDRRHQESSQRMKGQISIIGKYVEVEALVWIHYDRTFGQPKYGDYAQLSGIANKRWERVERGETYVRAKIESICWHYDSIQFNCNVFDDLGNLTNHIVFIKDPARLTLV